MPKDNEVDEKVEDFFERLYGMTFRLFLDPNSEEDEGNTVELRLGATVDNLALFETQDHAVLHTAATVAELRAEVAENEAVINVWRRRCEAAERRVGELERLRAETYQVVSVLLSDTGQFDSDHGQKILDNLSEARIVHEDVLPWATLTGADPT